jgi:DNA-binding CsgD family transcriptional regulator
MARKKITRAEDITEKDILSLYEDVLPVLYNNAIMQTADHTLHERLQRFIPHDRYNFLMLDSHERSDTVLASFLKQKTKTEKDNFDILITPSAPIDADTAFDEATERQYLATLQSRKVIYPTPEKFDYYRIISREDPKVLAAFFRFFGDKKADPFSAEEKNIVKKLTPHILIIIRTIYSFDSQSRAFQYFNTYINICAKLTQEYNFSETENKIMTELLFGKSNEMIARENFVSVAAVKKNIKHIFKKTGTKNRMDFIGRFFTSPERIKL